MGHVGHFDRWQRVGSQARGRRVADVAAAGGEQGGEAGERDSAHSLGSGGWSVHYAAFVLQARCRRHCDQPVRERQGLPRRVMLANGARTACARRDTAIRRGTGEGRGRGQAERTEARGGGKGWGGTGGGGGER